MSLQGTTVLSGYDILSDAGAPLTAVEKTFTFTVSGGTGITVHVLNLAGLLGVDAPFSIGVLC